MEIHTSFFWKPPMTHSLSSYTTADGTNRGPRCAHPVISTHVAPSVEDQTSQSCCSPARPPITHILPLKATVAWPRLGDHPAEAVTCCHFFPASDDQTSWARWWL